jgi:hypothetical protein
MLWARLACLLTDAHIVLLALVLEQIPAVRVIRRLEWNRPAGGPDDGFDFAGPLASACRRV